MNEPTRALRTLLSIVPLSIAVALLIVGCQQRSFMARTFVLGPVSCEPAPKIRVGKCEACMKAACCAELLACANDASRVPPMTRCPDRDRRPIERLARDAA